MASKKSKVELKRVNINLPITLIKKVEEYGESIGINTTSAYIVLLNQALNQNKQISTLPLLEQFLKAYQGDVDNENNIFNNIINDSNKMATLLETIENED